MKPALSLPAFEFLASELADPDGSAAVAARNSFGESGFFVCKGGAARSAIDSLQRTIEDLFRICAKPGEDLFQTCKRLDVEDKPLLYRVYQAIVMSDAIASFRLSLPDLWNVTRERAERRGVPVCFGPAVFFGLPEDERLALNWHQETTYLPGIDCLANYWIPLFNPSTKTNGTMSALVGSNKLGPLPIGRRETSEKGFLSLVPEGIETFVTTYPEIHFECAVGDVVVFQKDLIHRSNFNASGKARFTATVMLGRLTEIPHKLQFTSADY